MQKIILASNNPKKVAELTALLAPRRWDIVPQAELKISQAQEIACTFVENALIKARHAARQAGLPAIADDSGLVVDALDGAPGVFSARYAGGTATDADNNEKLLSELKSVKAAERSAHFHCTLVFLRHSNDPDPVICQGQWYGSVLESARGTHGFGYDPLFWDHQHQCSAAELSAATKGQLSHRGKAIGKLMQCLAAAK